MSDEEIQFIIDSLVDGSLPTDKPEVHQEQTREGYKEWISKRFKVWYPVKEEADRMIQIKMNEWDRYH